MKGDDLKTKPYSEAQIKFYDSSEISQVQGVDVKVTHARFYLDSNASLLSPTSLCVFPSSLSSS